MNAILFILFSGTLAFGARNDCRVPMAGKPTTYKNQRLAKRIKKIFLNEFRRETDTVGYYGVSLATFKVLMETGMIPPGWANLKFGGAGIYFAEISKNTPDNIKKNPITRSPIQAFKLAGTYANGAAFIQEISLQLGIKLTHEVDADLDSLYVGYPNERNISDYVDEALSRILKLAQVSENEFAKKFEMAKQSQYKGIILAIGKNVFQDYEVVDSYPDEGLFVPAPRGFSLSNIVGIHALGEGEKEFLTSLP